MHGFPGAGKTHFARQLRENIKSVHISSDRIRGELFEVPHYDKEENTVIERLMEYMAEELLAAGVSVIYDTNTDTFAQRRKLRELAKKAHAVPLLVWFQVDHNTAFSRIMKRDRRRADDKFARGFDRTSFDGYITSLQNPKRDEDFLVLSGKHSFAMQKSGLVRRLFDMNLISAETTSANVTKPGLVNLVPGRGDLSRRSIRIR